MRKVYVLTENTLWAEELQPQMLALDCQLAHLRDVEACRNGDSVHETPELVLLDYAQAHPKALAELQRIWPHSEIVLFGEAPLPTVFADLLRLGVLHYFCMPVTDPHQLALVILGCVSKATLRRDGSPRRYARIARRARPDCCKASSRHRRLTWPIFHPATGTARR